MYTISPPPSAEHADHIHLNPQHASNPLELENSASDAHLLLGLGALMLICLLTHMHENSLRELRSLLALGIRHAGLCICKCENSAQYSFAWMHDRYEGVWYHLRTAVVLDLGCSPGCHHFGLHDCTRPGILRHFGEGVLVAASAPEVGWSEAFCFLYSRQRAHLVHVAPHDSASLHEHSRTILATDLMREICTIVHVSGVITCMSSSVVITINSSA